MIVKSTFVQTLCFVFLRTRSIRTRRTISLTSAARNDCNVTVCTPSCNGCKKDSMHRITRNKCFSALKQQQNWVTDFFSPNDCFTHNCLSKYLPLFDNNIFYSTYPSQSSTFIRDFSLLQGRNEIMPVVNILHSNFYSEGYYNLF